MTPQQLDAIVTSVASLFDAAVIVEAATPAEAHRAALFPEERAFMGALAPFRQTPFAAGRVCARRALDRLGVAPQALVPHADRSPRWPAGVVGSISHTHGDDSGRQITIVVVALASRAAGLGLDVERADAAGADIEALACTLDERRWLDRQSPADRGRWVKLFFSAKEAFYKCQYPTTRRFLEFQDLALTIDPADHRFAARVLRPDLPALDSLGSARGRWAYAGAGAVDDLIVTGVALPGVADRAAGG